VAVIGHFGLAAAVHEAVLAGFLAAVRIGIGAAAGIAAAASPVLLPVVACAVTHGALLLRPMMSHRPE
jgi:hypothetical protein